MHEQDRFRADRRAERTQSQSELLQHHDEQKQEDGQRQENQGRQGLEQ